MTVIFLPVLDALVSMEELVTVMGSKTDASVCVLEIFFWALA